MFTEQNISLEIGRTIKSPIRVAELEAIGINKTDFLSFFRPYFDVLEDDLYLIRQQQIRFLETLFKADFDEINALHQDYFEGNKSADVLAKWLGQLDFSQKAIYKNLSTVTRQRSIASFLVSLDQEVVKIDRLFKTDFQQEVTDFRVWKRVFAQTPKEVVEHPLFYELLTKFALMVKEIHPNIKQVKFTAHFMRTIAQKAIPGENSPEGIHEDGAQYIVSALVINRQNVKGGESRIYEKPNSKTESLIYQKTLAPGAFIFQADTGEEKIFGNDLWHNVSPIEPIDDNKLGIRDIIGLDIDVVA